MPISVNEHLLCAECLPSKMLTTFLEEIWSSTGSGWKQHWLSSGNCLQYYLQSWLCIKVLFLCLTKCFSLSLKIAYFLSAEKLSKLRESWFCLGFEVCVIGLCHHCCVTRSAVLPEQNQNRGNLYQHLYQLPLTIVWYILFRLAWGVESS